MITLLLFAIALLLLVIASKVAPEQLNEAMGVMFVLLIGYLVFKYWAVILMVPVAGFYLFKSLANTEAFTWFVYVIGVSALAYAAYCAFKQFAADWKSGKLRLAARQAWLGGGKVILYAGIGTAGLILFWYLLVFIFLK